jgi:hypothetical protein
MSTPRTVPAAGGAGGPARPAAYVEYMLGGTDVGGGMQPLFMQARLGIEQFGVPDPELRGGLVRIDPGPEIRLITHPLPQPSPDSLAPAYTSHTPSGRSAWHCPLFLFTARNRLWIGSGAQSHRLHDEDGLDAHRHADQVPLCARATGSTADRITGSSPRGQSGEFLDLGSQFSARIASVHNRAGLEQQHGRFGIGAQTMLHTAGDDEQLPRREHHSAISHLNGEPPVEDQEKTRRCRRAGAR